MYTYIHINTAIKELTETKNIVKALNDELTSKEKKKKALELENDNT